MRARLFPWRTLLILALAGGVAGGLLRRARGRNPWENSARTVRSWSPRARVMAPADPPPFQPDTNLLQGLTLATNGRQTRVTLTRRGRFASPGPRLRWQVVEADERLRAGLGTNRVALEYVAVGWGRPEIGRASCRERV